MFKDQNSSNYIFKYRYLTNVSDSKNLGKCHYLCKLAQTREKKLINYKYC